jgi:N-acetylglucosaminyldiphosphoundecaprenol N-acetyl-beta-D-mannosaminyltransferase
MVLAAEPLAAALPSSPINPASGWPRPPRFILGGTPIDRISMDYAVLLLTEALLHRGSRPPLTVVGPNAHLVTLAQRNQAFAEALQSADISIPDGISVVLASRLLRAPIPERVTGGDLLERMCAESARHGFRVFFLGGLPGAAVMAAHNLRDRFPGLNICGKYCPNPGFENNPAELTHIRGLIDSTTPDLLCVAFGAPKQEIWIQQNRHQLPVGAILPVGAALDTQAGLRRRAPLWIQRIGLEWFFRLVMEPRRLWRRYLIGNTRFVFLVLRQYARERALPAARRTHLIPHRHKAGRSHA